MKVIKNQVDWKVLHGKDCDPPTPFPFIVTSNVSCYIGHEEIHQLAAEMPLWFNKPQQAGPCWHGQKVNGVWVVCRANTYYDIECWRFEYGTEWSGQWSPLVVPREPV